MTTFKQGDKVTINGREGVYTVDYIVQGYYGISSIFAELGANQLTLVEAAPATSETAAAQFIHIASYSIYKAAYEALVKRGFAEEVQNSRSGHDYTITAAGRAYLRGTEVTADKSASITISLADAYQMSGSLSVEIHSLQMRAQDPFWADGKDDLLRIASELQEVKNRLIAQIEAL